MTGQSAYAFKHSLLRIGLGQKSENLEWFPEGGQDAESRAIGRFSVGSSSKWQLGVEMHGAGTFVGELGWLSVAHFPNRWLRADYPSGRGETNPTNGRCTTFFRVLPTPRPYRHFPFYNKMINNEDFYGISMFRLSHSLILRGGLHALRLASTQDHWYGGGGAFQAKTFGYTERANGGNRNLANVWDVCLDVPLHFGFSVSAYYSHAWGKSVAASIYSAGTNAQFRDAETSFQF